MTRQRERGRCSKRCVRAMTLIEMLVAISIIGILLAITLPAVQMAREAARRADCSNRVRQLMLGVTQFSDHHGHLPGNGGPPNTPSGASPYFDKQGDPFIPSTTDLTNMAYYTWGLGDRTKDSRRQTGSWGYSILAVVELGAAAESDDREALLGIFHCPSRNRSLASTTVDDNQGLYRDGGFAMSKTDYCMNDQIATVLPDIQQLRSVSDGLSQTVFIGEKAIDSTIQTATSWYWDEPVWLGGSKGTARSGDRILPDAVGIEFRDNWGSAHAGGALFSMGDGSTHFVSESVDSAVMRAWMTPSAADRVNSGAL